MPKMLTITIPEDVAKKIQSALDLACMKDWDSWCDTGAADARTAYDAALAKATSKLSDLRVRVAVGTFAGVTGKLSLQGTTIVDEKTGIEVNVWTKDVEVVP